MEHENILEENKQIEIEKENHCSGELTKGQEVVDSEIPEGNFII